MSHRAESPGQCAGSTGQPDHLSYTGVAYQPQAEMEYTGLGQRLQMTAYAAGGLSLATNYILDSQRNAAPLVATANSQSTYYLYGLEAVAERASAWSYYLRDGLGSLRRVADSSADILYERSYTPWGDVLSQSGALDPSLGYLGGWVDTATGLIYVGSGQYYDPATGRFLTRDTQEGQLNPYTPGRGDPTGLLLGPLALLVLARGRKKGKKGNKATLFLVVLLVLLVGGMTLTACNLPGREPPKTDTQPPSTPTDSPDSTRTPTGTQGNTPTETQSPSETPTAPPKCPADMQDLPTDDVIKDLADYAFANTTIAISGDAKREKVEDYLRLIMDEAADNELNTNELAYVYATTQLESRWAEFVETYDGGDEKKYFEDKYGVGSPAEDELGNTEVGDGYKFRGRGFIHLTGRANYERVGRRLKIDLVGEPDQAFLIENVAPIAVIAMNEGLLTGDKLSDFNNGNAYDFRGARDIINGYQEPALSSGTEVREALNTVSTGYAEILSRHCALCNLPLGLACR